MLLALHPLGDIICGKETERAAQTLGIAVQSLEVQEPNDFGHAFEAAERHQPDALIMVEDPLTIDFRKQIADFALTHRLPAMNPTSREAALRLLGLTVPAERAQ